MPASLSGHIILIAPDSGGNGSCIFASYESAAYSICVYAWTTANGQDDISLTTLYKQGEGSTYPGTYASSGFVFNSSRPGWSSGLNLHLYYSPGNTFIYGDEGLVF